MLLSNGQRCFTFKLLVSLWAVGYLIIRVYVENFVASLCLQVVLYSAKSLRMDRQAGMSSTLGQGVVEECKGASWCSISWRMDIQTSSVCSCSVGACHWGSIRNKMWEREEKKKRTSPHHSNGHIPLLTQGWLCEVSSKKEHKVLQ